MTPSKPRIRDWWKITRNCFRGSYRKQVRINCRAYVAGTDLGTGSGLNDSNSDPLDQTEESLDDTDNQINEANLQERRAQLDIIIQGGLQRMDEKKVKYHFAGNEYVLQNQIAQAAKLVQWAKDWIGDAVKDSPQASMAWAGVCLILPLLTKPSAADQANRDGFSYVTTRMRYYVALEPLLLPKNHNIERAIVPKKLTAEFEIHIMDLYQHILDFQIRSVLRFYRSRLGNLKGDILSNEDWIQMQSTINNLETIVRNDSKQINSLSSIRELENLNKNARGSLETMQQLLSVAQKQLRVNQEHLQVSSKLLHVSKQQLQVQKQIAKKTLSQEEEKCHQLFRLTKDEKDDTYEWYKNRVEDRVENTCQWFLDNQNFKKWLKQDSGPLLVSADPGCGKSVLAKYLIDCELPRSATICYFFFKDQDQNTLKQALCALLHQLFFHKPSLIRHAMPEYSINGPNLVNITTSLWNILEKVGQDTETGPVIFVLDALDECTESDFRDLTRMLKRHFHKVKGGLGNVKFLLTSRPYGHIVCEFQELIDAFPYIHIPGEDESETISQEVNCVIKYRVNQLAKEKNLPANIRDHLEQRLLKIHHRTYLWVYLVFDYLKSQHFKKTEKGIESPVTTLPESVNQAYEAILSRSKNDQMVRKALCIILAASRPLTLAEMNIAININISSKSMEDLDLEKEEDFKVTLRTWCGLFVSIYDSKVYFLHQTAREFLLQELSSSAPIPIQPLHWHRSISAQQAHSVLAEICIIYLDVLLSYANPEIDQYNNNHIFLDYSAKSWAAHFREAHIRNDAAIISSVLRICDPGSKNCSTWFKIYWETEYRAHPANFSALMIASYFGLEGVVKLLLETGDVEADAKDNDGRTPLLWAAWNGHEAVVKLLLETGDVKADAKDNDGQTPLWWAAESGHEAVVKLLLETGNVEADAKDNYDSTPLLLAAESGHEAVVKLLLEMGNVKADAKDNGGRTPLWWAAEGGHEAVVKLLLETGNVEADAKNNDGRTPLWWAAVRGHEAVVKLLLETGNVEADAKDKYGQTPLWWAAKNGHEAVVKLLQP